MESTSQNTTHKLDDITGSSAPTLYVVATPIGNLADITFRAVETLKQVHFILAEDTRQTKKLLDHYNITTPLVSYRDQNHDKMLPKVLEKLNLGLNLALVSDNGTPLISDPGFKLVRALRREGFNIEAIPGPSALTAALSIAGLPTDRFTFLGFLPKSEKKRREIFIKFSVEQNGGGESSFAQSSKTNAEGLSSQSLGPQHTLVMYESPHRVLKLLKLLNDIYGDNADVAVLKDITKLHEEFFRGTPTQVLSALEATFAEGRPRGEFVVVLGARF